MAEVAAAFGEEFAVIYCYSDAATEAGAGHAIGEFGSVMALGVACGFFGHTERAEYKMLYRSQERRLLLMERKRWTRGEK